jgi:hypothetical protein
MSDISKRMSELMEPIDRQILMCDNREDMLMMACAMMQRTREIFDQHLGPAGRMRMFKDYAEKEEI